MKIISKYKDYYDGCVNSLGLDTTIIYNRINNIIDYKTLNHYNLYFNNANIFKNGSIRYNFNILGVCGKLYPLLIVQEHKIGQSIDFKYIYDRELIVNFFKEHYNIFYQKVKPIENYLTLVDNKQILDLFHIHKCGSFMLSADRYGSNYQELILEIEPNLNALEFYKIVDSFTLFNSMSSYISEQINTEIETDTLSDKEKIITKGFDPKYSFRHRK